MILRISDEICINDVRGKGFHPNYAAFSFLRLDSPAPWPAQAFRAQAESVGININKFTKIS